MARKASKSIASPFGAKGDGSDARLRILTTRGLAPSDVAAIRAILDSAFGAGEGAFTEDDWQHALGGLHFVLDVDGLIVSHAAVVERRIEIGERSLRTGYVEAVATRRDRERKGYGTQVMAAADEHIAATWELGVLGTGSHGFYERLGWRTWRGPMYVRTDGGVRRTPDDEGYLMVLTTPRSPAFELSEPITCEWRPGDVW